jgi:capsular exopolysaccharide synthesis family protein
MQKKEIHLRDYIQVILKRKSTVLVFFLITFLLAIIGTFTATPQYLASTKVLIEKNETNPLFGGKYYYTPQDLEFIETQIQIITSKSVARKVIKNLDLGKNYQSYFPDMQKSPGFLQTVAQKITDFIKSGSDELVATGSASATLGDGYEIHEYDWLADIISSNITVEPINESKIYIISFMSENPIFSRLVANSLVKAYMEELLEHKMTSSGITIKWMTQKADEEREKLKESEAKLQKYMRDNDIVTIEDRITVVPQKLVEFSSQLSRAEARRKELYSIYRQIEQATSDNSISIEAIPVIKDDKAIQDIRDEITKVQQKTTELSKKYGPKHPSMISAMSEQERLLDKKKEEIKRVINSVKKEYELAQANEDNLRNLLNQTKSEALGLNEKFVQYQVLKREVESDRTMYEALFSRLKEQNVTEESQNVNVFVVEQAETPIVPAKPRKMVNLLLGLVLSLFGGIVLAFFIEYLDNTINMPEEAEERLGLPMLGVINQCKFEKDHAVEQEVISLFEKNSTHVENFRVLRTALLLSARDRPPKSIVITSMMPGEGKSLIAANLAVTIARAGQRVLLIDADMRKPRQHKMFKLDNSLGGLSTYLAGAGGRGELSGPLASLFIIPAGPLPPDPSELLSSVRFKEMLRALQQKYDIVIIDSPPVVSVTDSLIMSSVVDGVILVTRAAKTPYNVVEKGVKSLTDVKAHILGMVVNGFNPQKYRYYYGKDYSQYYGNYYGSADS